TSPGENVYVVGNIWGKWDPKKGQKLKWFDGHIWRKTLDVPIGQEIEFKVVQVNDDGAANWESGDNRSFKALGPDYSLEVICAWDETGSTKVNASKLRDEAGSTQAAPAHSMDAEDGAAAPAAEKELAAAGSIKPRGATAGPSNLGWVGGRTEFTQSRKDRTEDGRSRSSEGLQGVEKELVDGDAKSPAWLTKMGLMKGLVVDRAPKLRPQIEELVACYVYSTWINNGAIQCVEGGSHNRPNKHAELAKEMVRSLEWVISEASAGASKTSPSVNGNGGAGVLGEEGRVLAARRLHTRLPSFSGEFRQSTPLTKIRDIAHSNYMPSNLKNEIKHTIQNKLHRCAGPEDLVATEEMLERITRVPGEYDSKFISDFQEFTQELREFFNATGLVDLLEATSPSIDDDHRAINTQLRAAMHKVDTAGADASVEALMNALSLATQARGFYMRGLSSGLRNDINDDALAMRQRWRLAEIRLEDYAFVVMSRIAGKLEEAGGANKLASANDPGAWKTVVGALTQGLRHLGFSHFAPKELMILENELEVWLGGANGMSSKMERPEVTALRAKSSVERCVRLASQFSDLVMGLYEGPAMRLGRALDVPHHMAQVFGESEVRASVAFQVSKLASLLSKGLRQLAKQEAWDALVTGALSGGQGFTQESHQSKYAACKGHDDDVVLLVRRAEGDEEVGPLGDRLAGVILLQELPHLSHLGVRARQEKVPFVTCDDEDYAAAHIQPLEGKPVKLQVAQGAVTLTPAATGKSAAAAAATASKAATTSSKPAAGPGVSTKVKKMEVVPLAKASTETCGAKAAKCGELERIARSTKGAFTTPPGVALPFGCMDCALAEAGVVKEFQACLQVLERSDLPIAELNSTCERMASIIKKASIPDNIVTQVAKSIAQGGSNGGPLLLAVRSSANVEDLAGLSAAGLYESKVGVPADDTQAVCEVIKDVWASLFSRRAVLSRRAAGVPHSSATMGVLIMAMVAPDISFVLHTARPHDSNKDVVMAEVAPGQVSMLRHRN
ncbi:pyruvate phosphate dikinase, partial [Dunaliella salina]